MIARLLGISLNHHHALEDARACAEIARSACQATNSADLYELAGRLGLQHGQIHHTGDYCLPYSGATTHTRSSCSKIDVEAINRPADSIDATHPFYGKVIAFTGTLACMSRRQAMQAAADMGAEVANGVTKHTNLLVIGEQDFRKFADGETKSAKLRRAEALLAEGQEIEILGEQDFLQFLGL